MQAAICTKKILLSHTIVCHLLVNDTEGSGLEKKWRSVTWEEVGQ